GMMPTNQNPHIGVNLSSPTRFSQHYIDNPRGFPSLPLQQQQFLAQQQLLQLAQQQSPRFQQRSLLQQHYPQQNQQQSPPSQHQMLPTSPQPQQQQTQQNQQQQLNQQHLLSPKTTQHPQLRAVQSASSHGAPSNQAQWIYRPTPFAQQR